MKYHVSAQIAFHAMLLLHQNDVFFPQKKFVMKAFDLIQTVKEFVFAYLLQYIICLNNKNESEYLPVMANI